MNIRAVIFDIYGTLLEVGPPPPDADARWQRLCRDLLRAEPRLTRLQFSIASNQVIAKYHQAARARGIPWPEVHWPSVVNQVVPELAILSRRDQDEFLFHQIQTGHTARTTAETAATLRWLKDRPSMLGIASNAQAYTLRELQESLVPHGLEIDLFDRDLCFWSFEHGFSKPDAHVFQILTTRLAAHGISPRETLMVGDRLDNDLEPARGAGWHTWHLTHAPSAWPTAGGWAAFSNHLHQGP